MRLDSGMAWRLHQVLIRCEFDFTAKGKISGVLWLAGCESPVKLELDGMPARDLAGHRLAAVNPKPEGVVSAGFPSIHHGVAGDMTASRKVRVLDENIEGAVAAGSKGPLAWHWGNALYLEWFSDAAGRVVIESADFVVTVEHVGAWQLSPEDEQIQQARASEAMQAFFERLAPLSAAEFEDWLPGEEEPPASVGEAEADAEDARMAELSDRVARRLRELPEESAEDYFLIYEEEREKLRKEMGEPEPEPLTPEEEERQNEWIEEMNRIAQEAMEELKDHPELLEHKDHPLVERCYEYCLSARNDLINLGLLSDNDSEEHPLQEWVFALQSTSAKLAGALNSSFEDEEWPPRALFAGSVLVRLKKARSYLRDGLMALRSVAEDELAPKVWIESATAETTSLLGEVEGLIAEVREVLADYEPEE